MLEILTVSASGEGKEGILRRSRTWATPSRTPLFAVWVRRRQPGALHHPPFQARVRDAHPRSLLHGRCVLGHVHLRCSNACPAHVNVPGYVSLIGEKRYDEALRLHRERNPLASICGRVCFHTCEMKCQRAALDEPVAIRSLKRFMTEQEIEIAPPGGPAQPRERQAEDRRRRQRPGRAQLRLLSRPPRIQAHHLREGLHSRWHAGAGDPELPACLAKR